MTAKNLNRRCQARTKSGKPCRAAATAGGLCFFHANPNKASELGRIGGRNNRHASGENVDPLPTLDNAIAVRDTVDRLIVDVHAGRTHPRIATCLAQLLNLQLRALERTEIADLERRLAKLENPSAEAGNPPRTTDPPVGPMSVNEAIKGGPLENHPGPGQVGGRGRFAALFEPSR
jgi:hypothetical protein